MAEDLIISEHKSLLTLPNINTSLKGNGILLILFPVTTNFKKNVILQFQRDKICIIQRFVFKTSFTMSKSGWCGEVNNPEIICALNALHVLGSVIREL